MKIIIFLKKTNKKTWNWMFTPWIWESATKLSVKIGLTSAGKDFSIGWMNIFKWKKLVNKLI